MYKIFMDSIRGGLKKIASVTKYDKFLAGENERYVKGHVND